MIRFYRTFKDYFVYRDSVAGFFISNLHIKELYLAAFNIINIRQGIYSFIEVSTNHFWFDKHTKASLSH
jgi:hypothetical protein